MPISQISGGASAPPKRTKPQKDVPVYDNGGDVSTKNFQDIDAIPLGKSAPIQQQNMYDDGGRGKGVEYGAFKPKSPGFSGGGVGGSSDLGLSSPKYMPGGGPVDAAPSVKYASSALPVYDEGGDVDVNDGKHQVAVLEDGEKVLTPEQAQAYNQEHGAPADFSGRVLPNPTGVTPQDSESIPLRTENLTGGGKVNMDLAHGTPEGDISNPQLDTSDSMKQLAAGKVIQKDKETAALNGDLVGMGKAVINQQHLTPTMHQDVAGGPLVSGVQTGYDKSTSRDLAVMEHKARLADYDQRIQQALDKGTPEGQEEADRLSLAKMNYQSSNPYGSAGNHPGVLGKVAHVAAKIGNIAGDIVAPSTLALIPGTELNRQMRRGALGSAISADTENQLRMAQADAANTKATGPKLLTGEGNVRTDGQGNRERAWEMADGTVRWVPEGQSPSAAEANQPTSSPLGRISTPEFTYGQEKPNTAEQDKNRYAELRSKQSTGQPLSEREQKEFSTLSSEYSVGQQAADASNRRIDAALKEGNVPKSEWADYHVSPTSTDAEVKEMEASAKNHAAELFQQGSENRQMDKEDRAQDRKDKSTRVYAEDENGQVRYMTKYEAEHYQVNGKSHPLSYEEMKPGDVSKDRQALRQLNDVQLNTSRYTKAAEDAIKTPLSNTDYVNIHSILNKAGALDLNIAIGEGGSIKIPVLSSMIEGLNREINSEAYAALSPQAKALVDGYIRTMAAIPSYQKALTGIGRSNKEMLDLELNNIANPSMKPQDILRKQEQFQENINRAAEGFPNNLPGLKTPDRVRHETEGKTGTNTQGPPVGATGTARGSDGNYYYHDKKGNILGPAPKGE